MGGRTGRERTAFEHIHECLFLDDHDTLNSMLRKLGVDYADKDGRTPLHEATRMGKQKGMDFLLGIGANINAQDAAGHTPVAIAVENGNDETLELLLSRQADPDIADEKGVTPLFKAVTEGEAGLVASLLTHGAKIDQRDPEGRSALMVAAQKGQAMILGALSGRGASLTATDTEGNTVMHYAAGCQDNGVVLQFLAEKDKALLNLPNAAGETPAIIAVKRHQAENLQTLLDLGADPAIADKSGMDAVAHGRALKRAKFRTAMKDVMESVGETARRDMRRGTADKITVRKPLKLKKTTSFVP